MNIIRYFQYIIFYIAILISNAQCRAQHTKEYKQEQEPVRVLIPFVPGNCHLCNEQFYEKLKVLDAKSIPYAFLLSEDFSEDLDYIKKEYKLNDFKGHQFILSTALFQKYYLPPQTYALEFGTDSHYKIYRNIDVLIEDVQLMRQKDTLDLGSYKIKKSASNLLLNNKQQMYIQNCVQTNTFDFIDLRTGRQQLKVSLTPQHLFNNYLLNFKDSFTAVSKLKEVEAEGIPKRDEFVLFEYVKDSIYATSMHTYIQSMKDSVLRSFYTMNLYKDGVYCGSRAISDERLPDDYYILPKFHIYNNAAYFAVVKMKLDKDKANYFLAKFELENGTYQFKKFLHFKVPPIHKEVGYQFIDLRFSDKYCMTTIGNILYDLETEQATSLFIPVNERFGFSDLMNNCKGVNILIDHIKVQYPKLLITFCSYDANGTATNKILNYNIENNTVEGRFQIPQVHSRFINSDNSRFGYFLWVPEKDNNDYLVYKKLF
ncbi:hypothetical protein D3C72_995410 [compost metagenome]